MFFNFVAMFLLMCSKCCEVLVSMVLLYVVTVCVILRCWFLACWSIMCSRCFREINWLLFCCYIVVKVFYML